MELASIVKDDIIAFLCHSKELLFNERDLQMHLAMWLKKSDHAYDDVDLEYYVPCDELDNYIWENELRLDIVVKKNGEFLPIELKYKTSSVKKKLLRFGENLSKSIEVMKNQGAHDLGLYNFWKDVRRVELVRNRFKHVKNGIAVFVTNDPSYLKVPRETSNNYSFRMNEGSHEKEKYWQNAGSSCATKNPRFKLEKEYTINWFPIENEDITLHCCIVTI